MKQYTPLLIAIKFKYSLKEKASDYLVKKFFFQQDGAPVYTSARSQTWYQRNFGRIIRKTEWHSNSLDFDSFDYYYWDAVVARLETKEFKNTRRLKKRYWVGNGPSSLFRYSKSSIKI